MARRRLVENTPRVIAVAWVLFGVACAAIPADEMALVAWFSAAFAVLAGVVDPQIRALLRPRSVQRLVSDLTRSRP
ncbi:MAG: hypothetical protein ABIQ72_14015 [Usitatibacter sp.]